MCSSVIKHRKHTIFMQIIIFSPYPILDMFLWRLLRLICNKNNFCSNFYLVQATIFRKNDWTRWGKVTSVYKVCGGSIEKKGLNLRLVSIAALFELSCCEFETFRALCFSFALKYHGHSGFILSDLTP